MANPVFYHEPVLLHEAIDGLCIRESGTYVDATFGGGGHSRAILNQLGKQGRLVVFDQDEDAWKNKPDDARVTLVKENFRYLNRFLRLHSITAIDGILADLGVSSYQFDTAERGFSTRFEGPLDMRMDKRNEKTAASVLTELTEAQLHLLFEKYGEVRNSKQLAKQIATQRKSVKLNTVESLKAMIEPVMKGPANRYLAQVFQALRIAVNDEFGALNDLLEQSVKYLNPGGRLCVISFHSLEDRIVKQFMKSGGVSTETNPLTAQRVTPLVKMITPKPIEATEEELRRNPRSRSAKLRVAEKI